MQGVYKKECTFVVFDKPISLAYFTGIIKKSSQIQDQTAYLGLFSPDLCYYAIINMLCVLSK